MSRRKRMPYSVVPIEKDGEMVQHVQVPVRDLMEYGNLGGEPDVVPKKRALLQRIGALFARDRMEKTADVDDEHTTDTGSAAKSESSVASGYYEQIRIEHRRQARLKDYERMDNEDTILWKALNVRTENAYVSREGDQDSFKVEADDGDPKTEMVLEDLVKRLDLHEQMPGIHRSALKYGDEFEEKVFDSAHSMLRLKWLHPRYMRRNEDNYGRVMPDNAFSMVDDSGEPIANFKHWQVAHWRHNHRRGDLYGSSMMFASRRPFRITHLMEDGVAINRMVRSTDKLVFYVPVAKNADQAEVRRVVSEVAAKFKRKANIDGSGRLDLTKNPLGDDEDIFIGTWEGSPAKVERLAMPGVTGQLWDLEHFENQKIMGTGVPKSYLGLERDVNAKATLSWQDIEFARGLRGDQKEAALFIRNVCDSQLKVLLMPTGQDVYTVEFPPISFVDEEMKMTVLQLRWTIASLAKTTLGIPVEWLLENIIGLGSEDVETIMTNIQPVADAQIAQGRANGMNVNPPKGSGLGRVREDIMGNQRVVMELNGVRDMLDQVIAAGLHRNLVA